MPRNLRLLLAAQFVSLLGDGLYLAVILYYALKVTGGSEQASGLVVVAENLPYLLVGIWAGVLVDRLDRRRVMMGADLLRAAVLLALFGADRAGWMAAGGPLMAVPVGFAAALLTLGTVFFNPARDALVPSLVPASELTRANAAIAVSQYAAQLLGPLAAALILAARPLAEAFLWDALTFLGSFACLAALRPPAGDAGAPREAVDVKGALAYVAGRPELKGLLVLTVLNNLFIMGPALVGSALLVRDVAARGGAFVLAGRTLSGEAMYALYLSCFAAGMILGSVAVARLARHVARWKLLIAGVVLDGLTFLPFEGIAAEARYPLLLLAVGVHATVVPLIVVVRPAQIQAHVPGARLGQVFALVNLTVFGSTALSAALAGWLAGQGTAPGHLFTYAAWGGALSGVLALGMPSLRKLT